MMASGKNAQKSKTSVPLTRVRQGLPWLTIVAVVVVLALVGSIFAFVYSKQHAKDQAAAAVAPFVPSATNMDPSTKIPGIYVGQSVTSNGTITYVAYKAALHVSSTQRVAYDRFPPVGGPHDAEWAACNGVVYTKAVRDENMVHILEHGAIWIAYNPATIKAGDLAILKSLVVGKTYIALSPYPTLDQPISLQSWAHQLKVQSASDARIKEFITALQQNIYTTPENNGSCDQPSFNPDNPPAFDPSPRGADAIPLDGAGLTTATSEAVAPDADGSSQVTASAAPTAAGATTSAATTAAAATTASK